MKSIKSSSFLIGIVFLTVIEVCTETGRRGNRGLVVEEKARSSIFKDKQKNSKDDGVHSRKALVPASNHHGALKPAPHGMSMTFQPIHNEQGTLSMGTVHHAKAEHIIKKLHIAPTFSLAQSLNTLDKIGSNNRRTLAQETGDEEMHLRNPATNKSTLHQNSSNIVIPYKQNIANIVNHNKANFTKSTNLKLNNATVSTLQNIKDIHSRNLTNLTVSKEGDLIALSDSNSVVTKKDARPNVITDTPIKGFLAKDVNFTIHDVGNKEKQSGIKKKEGESKSQKIMKMQNSSKSEVITMSLLKPSNASELEPTATLTNSSNATAKHEVRKITSSTAVNGTKRKIGIAKKPQSKLHLVSVDDFVRLRPTTPRNSSFEDTASPLKKDKIDSAYHEAECNEDKKCPKNKYCRHYSCYDCHRKHHECMEDDECCDQMPCVYGRCDEKPKGSPGTICGKDGDCGDGCCVIEPTIDEEHGICKKKLAEFHQCSPVLFRKVWVGEEKPNCGPCQAGLDCVEKGVIASHLVCMKKKG